VREGLANAFCEAGLALGLICEGRHNSSGFSSARSAATLVILEKTLMHTERRG